MMKSADGHFYTGWGRERRRGSTLIVMLGILAFMTLLFTTLSVTGRLEIMAAHKFADGYRDNGVAVAGIQAALATLEQHSGPVALNQPWARPEGLVALARSDSAERSGPSFLWSAGGTGAAGAAADPEPDDDGADGPMQRVELYDQAAVYGQLGADITVQDESGKINLNAVGTMRMYGDAMPLWQPRGLPGDVAPASRPGGARYLPVASVGQSATAQPVGSSDGASARMAGVTGIDSAVLRGPADLDLAQALHRILESQGVTGVNAAELARRIILYRHGDDGRLETASVPGAGAYRTARGAAAVGPVGAVDGIASAAMASPPVDDPYAYVSDPRRPAQGDDRPFRRVEDLLNVPGVTHEIYEALRDHVTVFSASADVVPLSDQALAALAGSVPTERLEVPKTPLNTATVYEIKDALRTHFPHWNTLLVRQFAANIVDARDDNHIPTVLEGEDGLPILGIEITPYINEVWPDSITSAEDGDDGQFVELYNPYDVTIDVTGWVIDTGVTRTTLHGAIRPGGFLIITDDFNGTRDAGQDRNRPGYGSFYDIFGIMPNGTTRLLVEDPFFALPDDSGVVWMYDREGNPIDYFPYSGGRFDGVERSFQRDDPRVRASRLMRPTPFARNASYDPPPDMAPEALFPSARQFNQPFASVGDILHIHAGRAGSMMITDRTTPAGGSVNVQTGTFRRTLPAQYTEWSVSWAWPQVFSEDGSEPDLRLLDIFCLDVPAELQFLDAWQSEADAAARYGLTGTGPGFPEGQQPGLDLAPQSGQTGPSFPAARWLPAPPSDGPRRQFDGLGAFYEMTVGPSGGAMPMDVQRPEAGQGAALPLSPAMAPFADLSSDGVAWRQAMEKARMERSELLRLGRLNVNTASAEALAAVPMAFPDGTAFGDRVVTRRIQLQRELESVRNWQGAPFPTLSAFFQDDGVFGDLGAQQRMEAARRLASVLTVDSRSFRVISRCRSDEQGAPRRMFTRSAEALVCVTQVGSRMVTWRYLYGEGRRLATER